MKTVYYRACGASEQDVAMWCQVAANDHALWPILQPWIVSVSDIC